MLPDAHCHAEAARAAEQEGGGVAALADGGRRRPRALGQRKGRPERGRPGVLSRVWARFGRVGGAHGEEWVGEDAAQSLMSQGGEGVWGQRVKRARARRYACSENEGTVCVRRRGFGVDAAAGRGAERVRQGMDGGSRRLLHGYGRSVHPAISQSVVHGLQINWVRLDVCWVTGGGQRPVRVSPSPSRGGSDGPARACGLRVAAICARERSVCVTRLTERS